MPRLPTAALAAVPLLSLAVYAFNRSDGAPADGPPRWLAHRGVHQTFSLDGVDNETCTATRIHEPTHGHIENTLPSMRAAVAAGAYAVELDLHRTSDGEVAVFHDATLECRTDGVGRPEDHTLAELRQLDLGYGYTADGGATFPLRGHGVGLLPTLDEVLAAFPDTVLLLHLKADDGIGPLVARRLMDAPPASAERVLYGHADAVADVLAQVPGLRTMDGGSTKACLGGYLALGWAGYVPAACHDRWIAVPVNVAPYLWGWPRRAAARLHAVDADLVVVGPYHGGQQHVAGVDSAEERAGIPEDFHGLVWTNRIETIRREPRGDP